MPIPIDHASPVRLVPVSSISHLHKLLYALFTLQLLTLLTIAIKAS